MYLIKEISCEDILACSELYVRIFNSHPWNDSWTKGKAYKRLMDIYNSTNFQGVLYIEDNNILGAMFGNLEEWYEGMHFNLKEMFVDQGYQGRGIGSLMLKELEDRIKVFNVCNIILFTSRGNNTYDFYMKNGFEVFEDMVMMGKEIL